jgi:hypothetical protein
MELRRLLAGLETEGKEDQLIMADTTWKPGPQTCEACGADLRKINPYFGIKDKPGKGWCSKACRATVTGESVDAPARKDKAEAPEPAAPATAPKGKEKKAGTLPDTPRREREAPAAPAKADKAPAAPRKQPAAPTSGAPKASGLKGTLTVVPGVKKLNPEGNRGKIFGLAKTGMTVAQHEALVTEAGLGAEYLGNMRVLIKNGCITVSE